MIFQGWLLETRFVVWYFTCSLTNAKTSKYFIFSKCLAEICLSRVLAVSGPRSGRSHSVVHYSGTKCHEVIYTLYNIDNPVTLRTGVHKGSLREPWAASPCKFCCERGTKNGSIQRFLRSGLSVVKYHAKNLVYYIHSDEKSFLEFFTLLLL